MSTNKRFLAPGFINKLDRWLLLNKPETWSARTHLVWFYGWCFMIILGFLEYIFPDDPRTETGIFNWVLFTTLIALIALVVYVIYLLRFNVFKRYGLSRSIDRLKTFLLYFLSIGMIVLIPFLDFGVESFKANKAFSDVEMVKDVNTMNQLIVQLERDSLDHVWDRDTFRIVDSVPGKRVGKEEWVTIVPVPPPPPVQDDTEIVTVDTAVEVPVNGQIAYYKTFAIKVIDTADFSNIKSTADSLLKLDDSTWIQLECPDYIFINSYRLQNTSKEKEWVSVDLYHNVIEKNLPFNRSRNKEQLSELIEKYRNPNYSRLNPTEVDLSDATYLTRLNKRYDVSAVENGLNNIAERKNFTHVSTLEILWRVFFYITLLLTLLLFMFRHTTPKTFFFMLLSIAVLMILTALFIALTRTNAKNFFNILIFYFIIFLTVGIAGSFAAKRSVFAGIALNLTSFMLGFLPLIVVASVYAMDERYGGSHSPEYYERMEFWLRLAEIAGPVLLLVSLCTWLHYLYRKWYALPEA